MSAPPSDPPPPPDPAKRPPQPSRPDQDPGDPKDKNPDRSGNWPIVVLKKPARRDSPPHGFHAILLVDAEPDERS